MERTALLYLCGLLIYGIEASDSSCRLKDLTMQPQCCTPKTYIEVKFFLRLRSNGSCDSIEYLDQGIRFEVGIVSTNRWIPIRYYAATTTMGPTSLVKLVNNTHVEAVFPNYNSTFPLQVFNSTEPIKITEYLCGEQFVTPVTRFRWFQRYSGASLADRNTWSLDNLTITLWNGSCHSVIMEEDFEDDSRIMTNFAESTGGIVVEPPCGETASGRALYFQGNISGGVSRRRLKMHRTNFASPNTVCNTPLKEGSGCSLDGTSCTSDAFACSLGTFDCSCKVGYRREGFICVDVNECDEDLHDCSQLCVNSEGSYHCICHPGYRMDNDRITCSDINECSMGLNNCSGECHNTGGSFECLCSPGFQLDEDGVTCTPTVASVGFEQGAYNTHEGEEVQACILMQNDTLERAVNVSLSSVDQSATAPQDYIGISTHLLLTPSETRKCINITLLDDSIVEEREKFALELASSEVGILLNPNKTTITIQDTDRAGVGLIETIIQVSETNRSVELCAVIQNTNLDRELTVTLSTHGGSATAGDDYTATAVDLYFSSARYRQCTTISLMDDFILEGVEMFTVNLNTSDAMVLLMPAVATVIITDNDYVDMGLDVAAYTVLEDDRSVEVCASIMAGSLGVPVNVLLVTADGTATASSDYHSVVTLLSFDSSISHVCVNISVEDDQLAEQEEHFSVAISTNESHSLLRIEVQEAVVTILDNDGITIGLESATYSVDEGRGSVWVCTVVQSGLLGKMLNITMFTQDGSATAPGDYSSITVDMTFDEVSNSSCARIAIMDDDSLEGVESFNIKIVLDTAAPNNSAVLLRPDTTTVYISDNDGVSIGLEHTVYTVSEDVGDVEVCAVVINGTVERTVALSVFTDSSPAAPTDYSEITMEMTFSAGSNRSCARVNITDDEKFENIENFTLGITTTDADVFISHNTTTVVIIDNDYVDMGLDVAAYTVLEDDRSVEVCASIMAGSLGVPINVLLVTADGTATASSDYHSVVTLLSFDSSISRVCVNISVEDDQLAEREEHFSVAISTNESHSLLRIEVQEAVVTILDNDGITIGLESATYSVDEGRGSVWACTVVQSGLLGKMLNITMFTQDGSATAPNDYNEITMEMTFSAGSNRSCARVNITDDEKFENVENFTLGITTTDADVFISHNTTTVVIIDNDFVGIGFSNEVFQAEENQLFVEVCAAVINGTLERKVIVSLTTENGSAHDTEDYIPTHGLLTFQPDATRKCLNVVIVNDTLLEGAENFIVKLTNEETGVILNPARARVQIEDDDAATIGFLQMNYSTVEGEGAIEVGIGVLQGQLFTSITVQVYSMDGSATSPTDYIAFDRTLTFNSATTEQTFSITINDDQTVETSEIFYPLLSSTTADINILLHPLRSTLEIKDDDAITFGFETENYGVRENEGSLEICAIVIGNGSVDRDVEITMATLSGTALAPSDYTATSTQLIFTANEERLCMGIEIIDDQLAEETEELQVQIILSTPELSITVSPDSTTVSILDNDRVMIGFENSHLTVREDEGSVDVCTVLSGSLEKTIEISVHTENDTATEASDYSAVSTVLHFSANTTRLCTTIFIEEDDLFEEGERFSVHLECSDPIVVLSPAVAAVVITDSGGTSDLINIKQKIAAGQLNATNAINILDDLLSSQLSDGQTSTAAFRMAFVEIATTLLDKIRGESQGELLSKEEVTSIASRLLTTLDRFALKSFSPDRGGELETETLKLKVQTTGQNENMAIVGIEEDGNEIVLPSEIIRKTGSSEVRVASYFFQNMTGVLPDTSPDLNESRLVSPVISSLLGCGVSICGRITTTDPIRVVLRHEDYQVTLQEPNCVFWEFVNEGDSVNGRWSKQGCEVSKEESSTTTTVCVCNHLTHFAILLSPRVEVSEHDAAALGIIGYVGVSISLICLLLTVAAFLFLRSLWGMRNYIHINLCISLFVAQLTFVAGVDKTNNEKACQAIAVLLHYFFLVTFMWVLMEGVVLYVALVRVFVKKQKYYIAGFTIVSYGLPALYMVVTVPLGFLLQNGPHYGSDAGCWLRYDTHFIWAFIAPVILIILANCGFFIMAICIMYRHDKRRLHKSKLQSAKHWLRSCISLVIIMGISWIMGVLAFHHALLAVSYIFTIFIAFQGLFIFILFVPVSKQVRESYKKWWRSKVAGSDFLSQFFSVEKQRRFTRTTSLGSSVKVSKHQQSVVDCPTTSQANGGTLDEKETTAAELQAEVCNGDTKTAPPLPAENKMKSVERVFTELDSPQKITAANAPLENNTELHKDAEEHTLPLRETRGDGSQDSDEECTAF